MDSLSDLWNAVARYPTADHKQLIATTKENLGVLNSEKVAKTVETLLKLQDEEEARTQKREFKEKQMEKGLDRLRRINAEQKKHQRHYNLLQIREALVRGADSDTEMANAFEGLAIPPQSGDQKDAREPRRLPQDEARNQAASIVHDQMDEILLTAEKACMICTITKPINWQMVRGKSCPEMHLICQGCAIDQVKFLLAAMKISGEEARTNRFPNWRQWGKCPLKCPHPIVTIPNG